MNHIENGMTIGNDGEYAVNEEKHECPLCGKQEYADDMHEYDGVRFCSTACANKYAVDMADKNDLIAYILLDSGCLTRYVSNHNIDIGKYLSDTTPLLRQYAIYEGNFYEWFRDEGRLYARPEREGVA